MTDFDSGEIDFKRLSEFKALIRDNTYFDFIIESQNAGFFYGQSLQIYGFPDTYAFHDIYNINALLKTEYGKIVNGLTSFGQDLFGNQFCFDIDGYNVVFFDSETGARENIASDFTRWLDVLSERLSYFTGINIWKAWQTNNQLDFDQRLCPKIPFVMGGEYKVDNLYASKFPAFVKAYANIARQVYDLPDGSQVKLNTDKK